MEKKTNFQNNIIIIILSVAVQTNISLIWDQTKS